MSVATSRMKTPPYSVASEKSLLADLLHNPALLKQVRGIIPNSGAFFRPHYGHLYDTLCDLHKAGTTLEEDAVITALAARLRNDRAGAARVVREVQETAGDPPRVLDNAREVQDKFLRRQLIDALSVCLAEANNTDEPYETLITRSRERITALPDPQ